MTTWSVFLHNAHGGCFCEVPLGVTKGSLLGRSSTVKNIIDPRNNIIDPLISFAWAMELLVDSMSILSSWERRTMAKQRLARASRKRGM